MSPLGVVVAEERRLACRAIVRVCVIEATDHGDSPATPLELP